MINSNCPICKNQAVQDITLYELKKNSDNFTIRECGNCTHIYSHFSQKIDLKPYYEEMDYRVKETSRTLFYTIQEKEYQPVIKRIKKLVNTDPIALLDFGSGKGLFLNFAKKQGLSVYGVETASARAAYAQNHFGLNISTDNYTEGKIFGHSFEAITLFHVLEHLENPAELLKKLLADNLKEGGLLVLEVPNFDSWQSKWSGKDWLHLDVPRHINHFTPQNLNKLLDEIGFEVKRREFFSWHLGIIGMMQSIWSWFGYQGFLIGELKENKSLVLLIKIALSLPFAWLLEGIASGFNKGGVLRYYAQKTEA